MRARAVHVRTRSSTTVVQNASDKDLFNPAPAPPAPWLWVIVIVILSLKSKKSKVSLPCVNLSFFYNDDHLSVYSLQTTSRLSMPRPSPGWARLRSDSNYCRGDTRTSVGMCRSGRPSLPHCARGARRAAAVALRTRPYRVGTPAGHCLR